MGKSLQHLHTAESVQAASMRQRAVAAVAATAASCVHVLLVAMSACKNCWPKLQLQARQGKASTWSEMTEDIPGARPSGWLSSCVP